MTKFNPYYLIPILAALLIYTGCSVHPHTLEREFNIVSEEKETDIGRTAHPQILAQFGYYHDERLQQYIRNIGQKLVRACPRQDITYHFTILDDPMENAFAVPGGYIYITRGILAILNSEAELAGVLGHEIGHIVGKDSATLMSQNLIGQFAVLAGMAGAVASSSSPDLAIATSQLFSSIMLGYSRKKEYRADEESVEYLVATGYDPTQIILFMRTLSYKSQGPTGMQQYLTTHPYIFDRMSRVEAKSKVVTAMRGTMNQILNKKETTPEKGIVLADKYKSHIDGLAYGSKENLRYIKIYTAKKGDTFTSIARRTLGSALKAKELARLNGMPQNSQLLPRAKIKTIF